MYKLFFFFCSQSTKFTFATIIKSALLIKQLSTTTVGIQWELIHSCVVCPATTLQDKRIYLSRIIISCVYRKYERRRKKKHVLTKTLFLDKHTSLYTGKKHQSPATSSQRGFNFMSENDRVFVFFFFVFHFNFRVKPRPLATRLLGNSDSKRG